MISVMGYGFQGQGQFTLFTLSNLWMVRGKLMGAVA